MKKILLLVTFVYTSFLFAQEDVINSSYEVFAEDNVKAYSLIETLNVSEEYYKILPETYTKYLFVKGNEQLSKGNIEEAVKCFYLLKEYETGPVYTTVSGKPKYYFLDKKSAKIILGKTQSLKEVNVKSSLYQKIIPVLLLEKSKYETTVWQNYKSKKYNLAASQLVNIYHVLKELGNEDKIYLYYAAISYAENKEYDKALTIYEKLIEENYTGVATLYYAKDKETGKEISLNKEQFELVKINDGYTDFRQKERDSILSDIYVSTISILIQNKNIEKAKQLLEKGIEKFPENEKLIELKKSV